MKNIGVLALQGAYHAHKTKLEALGYQCTLVKTPATLQRVDALILPGGESTTMIHLLKKHRLWLALKKKITLIPTLATCAGVILLQRLKLLAIEIIRNGYGPQLASGIFPLNICLDGKTIQTDGFFIRAPIINRIDDSAIQTLATFKDKPVLIQKGHMLAATFHPELADSSDIHRYFCDFAYPAS